MFRDSMVEKKPKLVFSIEKYKNDCKNFIALNSELQKAIARRKPYDGKRVKYNGAGWVIDGTDLLVSLDWCRQEEL